MATQKKAWLSALATFVLIAVIGLTFAFKPFDRAKTSPIKASTTWYFIGENLSDATTASSTNWTKTNPSLGCGLGTAVPCALTVMDAPDLPSLQTFLNGKTAVQIRDTYADSKRAE